MKKFFLFEPAIASNNIGDQVIVNSIKWEMKEFFQNHFCIELPTHTPISNRYMYFLGKPDLKFVCGSNIIVGNLNPIIHLKQWMLNPFTVHNLFNSIFIGVGVQQYNQQMGMYTRQVYKKLFHKVFLHSVRDSYTEQVLKGIGIKNVINTGCPTMWCLTDSHCQQIPIFKSSKVVFTLTDYNVNIQRDSFIIQTLKKEYEEVFFWPQGYGDYSYFLSLEGTKGVKIIPPHLADYDTLLGNGDIDYIGTRLHGGVRALQKGIRTLIIGIDNRAIEIHKDFNLPVLIQSEIGQLSAMINEKQRMAIRLPIQNINRFLTQFQNIR